MSKMRTLIERYEKWMMIALVVFLMVIFTATSDIQSAFMGTDERAAGADDVIGSFYVVPDQKVEITNGRYAQARLALRVMQDITRGPSADDVSVLDVWSHLILSEAARQEGIHVSDRDLVNTMKGVNRGLAALMADRENYTDWVRTRYRINLQQFEEAFREALTALRVRELHADTFGVAPPATRKELVERHAPGSFEYVDVSWGSLDASQFADVVAKEFETAADKDKLLKEFFETDPSVKGDTTNFRHRRRFEFEMLYTNHSRLTAENLKRLEEMFFKAWPDFSPDKHDGKDVLDTWPKGDDKKYWDSYGERLLEAEGRTADEIREKAIQQIDAEDAAAKKDADESGNEDEANGEDENPDEAEPDEPKDDPVLEIERLARIKKAHDDMGFDLLKARIHRELRLRRLYRYIHNDAFRRPELSLEKIYEKLAEFDDKENPLLTTTPGEGLVVFRTFDKPLSRQEIEELKDGELTFGPNVAFRVSAAAREKLPSVRKTADIMGDFGHGRMSLRVTGLERERFKTFIELSDGEKMILRDEYYLPYEAGERARKVLGELKKSCDEGKIKPDGFRAAAEAVGARVYEDEKITASSRYMTEPDRELLFPTEFQRMRDRHFLRSHLASLLAADRIKKEEERIKPGSWLDIELRTDPDPDELDAGTAYLILLIDRKKPTASTMPEENLIRAKFAAERQGLVRDRERWNGQYQQLFHDFSAVFNGTMKTQIEGAFERMAQSERDRASASGRSQ